MRAHTGPERAAIGSAHHDIHVKFEITDPDGAWVDVSTGLDDPDWFNSATLEDDVDANSMTMTAELLRDTGTASLLSLAPLREDSTLNRDSLDDYAPMLDVHRKWRKSVSVVQHGIAPSYKPIGEGYIDRIGINDPTPSITLNGRDLGAALIDHWIDTERVYSAAGTSSMEEVLQAMLDDNGFAAITLYTPTSPLFVMNKWTQQKESLMSALNAVADLQGMVVRYRYDSSDVFRLTLYAPDRAETVEDWELGPAEYTALPIASLDISGVRNNILLRYFDSATGLVATHTETDATSVARFGKRTLEIDLSEDSNVTTAGRANTLAETILADTAFPPIQQQVEAPGFWIVQLGDYAKFLANGVHYDTDQFGGVTHISHRMEQGALVTVINAGGQPRGRYRSWVATAVSKTDNGPPTALITSLGRNRRREILQFDGVAGGVGPLEWRYKVGDAAYSLWSATPLPVQIVVTPENYWRVPVQLQTKANGQITTSDPYVVVPTPEGLLGHSARRIFEDFLRGGMGGVPVYGGHYHTQPMYDVQGAFPLIDPVLRRLMTDLFGPTGIGMTVVERGGNKGDNALDSLFIVLAAAIDFARAYTGKHLGNLPDDASSDRRAVSLNQRTGAGRAFNALNSSDRLTTGVESTATAPDGRAPMESRFGAHRRATAHGGFAATGVVLENKVREGDGGVPVVGAAYHSKPLYDRDGVRPLIDPVTREILQDLGIGDNVRGKATVVFGATVKYPVSRHNENHLAADTGALNFLAAYEAVPQVRVLPKKWTIPGTGGGGQAATTANRTVEMEALGVDVSGIDQIRAVITTGETTSAKTASPALTLNGSTAASRTLNVNGDAAFYNLTDANANPTTYSVQYDIDTTGMIDGQLKVALYTNDGTSSTNWTEVASATYDIGNTWSNAQLSFVGAMAANWDLRLVISKVGGHIGFGASVVAETCSYNQVTTGTELTLTPGTERLSIQVMEQV